MRIDRPGQKLQVRLIQVLPNLITIAAICFGVTAIRFAIEGNFELAVKLVLLAGVLDALDGRVARLLRIESAFGAELDSLADFVNFGVAPALILYFWGLQSTPSLGWIAALTFAICCGLRLARFNVANRLELPSTDKRFFVGVPAPGGAFLALLPMFIAFSWGEPDVIAGHIICAQLIGVGLLMISRLPTPSFQAVTIYRENIMFHFVGFGVVVAAALTHFWLMLAACSAIYLAVIASILWSRWRR